MLRLTKSVSWYHIQRFCPHSTPAPFGGTLSPGLRPQARFGAQPPKAALSAEMRGYASHINDHLSQHHVTYRLLYIILAKMGSGTQKFKTFSVVISGKLLYNDKNIGIHKEARPYGMAGDHH